MNENTSPSDASNQIVVVVEDEPLIRELEIMLLEDLGYRTVDFTTGETALRYLEQRAGEISVVFSDIRMPGSVDGLVLARTIAKRWPWIRVALLSGHAQPEDLALPREMRFIRKPFSPAEVIGTLSEWT
jgi:CheY-like chemotaxis protein